MRAAHPDIATELFARTTPLKQSQINLMLERVGAPALALTRDSDGQGYAIGVAKIEKAGRRFEFREDGARAVVIAARDQDGEPADLVAWLPNEGWFAPWLGTVPLLGMQDLTAPRLGMPLPVYLEPGGWFRAGREGVVVLDRKRVWLALEGITVAAATVDDGIELRRILEHPKPQVVVSAAVSERIAA